MNAAEGMKGKCARCHRPFTVRKEGQIYGPTCERKMQNKPDPACPVDPDVCPGDCGKGAALDVYDERGNLLERGRAV